MQPTVVRHRLMAVEIVGEEPHVKEFLSKHGPKTMTADLHQFVQQKLNEKYGTPDLPIDLQVVYID